MATAFPTATTGARTTPTATERTTAPPAQPPSSPAVSNSGNDDSQPKKDAPGSCMHKRADQGLRTAQVFRAVRKAASPQRNTRRTGGESFQRRTKNGVAAWHGAAAALLRSAIYFIACSACLACAAPLKRLKNTPRMRSAARAGLPGTFHRHSTPGAGMPAVPQGTAPGAGARLPAADRGLLGFPAHVVGKRRPVHIHQAGPALPGEAPVPAL